MAPATAALEQTQDSPLVPDTPQALTPRPLAAGPVMAFGLSPTTLDEAWRFAKMFADSELVPKDYRNKPGNVIVAMQYGAEVGLAPMQSLQSIAVINGRPAVWGDGFLALIMASSIYVDHDEYYEASGARVDRLYADDFKRDDTAAVCKFWRKGRQAPFVVAFTVGMAKKAGLLTKEGPWSQYPDRMMRMRARSLCGRDAFASVLRGLCATEEALDMGPLRVETVHDEGQRVTQSPRRASESKPPLVTEASAQPTPAAASSSNALSSVVKKLHPQNGRDYWTVTRGEVRAFTYDKDIGETAERLHAAGTPVELDTEAIQGYQLPKLTGIGPAGT